MDTYRRIEQLKQACAPYYGNLAEAAIRFVLSDKRVSTLIPGMKNLDEVNRNVALSDGAEFPEELKQELRKHLWVRDYYL